MIARGDRGHRQRSPSNCDAMNDMEYKPVSVLSVVALLTSVVAVAAFLATPILVCAIASMAIAASSIRSIRRYNLSGIRLAVTSFCIAGSTLILAPAWHSYLFSSESLPGHLRVDFSAAKISQSTALDEYANKAICLKGYVLAPSRIVPMHTFQLSPDGNNTKSEITITVTCPFEWEYEYAPVAVSGILTVNPHAKDPAQRYVLAAGAIHRSNTSHGLVPRVPGRGC
jgi:hypothetical protein